ncbi:hypothetical protein Bhyg_15374 [Pseudolycoriella hygida]|uniref:RING-type domain-containing protein n=1 Tax=Pseudolycoriella hygida TaxID=35572 RepID=A0A9Q0MTE8_9DIPT|nr:hypothetical protein Bhyg_15374 [Pseudolycoriella hygida]
MFHASGQAPSSHRSKSVTSGRSTPSSRHSDNRNRPPLKIPVWVHCQKCYCSNSNNLNLLTCLHIFCQSCLGVNDAVLPHEEISCPGCGSSVGFRLIDSSLKESKSLEPQWTQRYNASRKLIERVKNKAKLENEIISKTNSIKAECSKRCSNIKRLHALYKRKKLERLQSQHQQKLRYQSTNMKFISSGRNEQLNHYIGQVMSSHYPTNQIQIGSNLQNVSQRLKQRATSSVGQYCQYSSKQNSEVGSIRSSIQSATFRPNGNGIGNVRYEPTQHAQKRFASSYNYDEYYNSSKRPTNRPMHKEINLDTSQSSYASLDFHNFDSSFA